GALYRQTGRCRNAIWAICADRSQYSMPATGEETCIVHRPARQMWLLTSPFCRTFPVPHPRPLAQDSCRGTHLLRRSLLPFPCRLFAALAVPAAELTVVPQRVELHDAFEGRQLLVALGDRDVTRAARYTSSDPAVVRVDRHGYLSPAGDGTARIDIVH